MKCVVKDCDNTSKIKSGKHTGLCPKHRSRMRRHNDIDYIRPTAKKRFFSYIEVHKETGCWEWTGGLNVDGYGAFSIPNKSYRAHRWSYEYFKGEIPKDKIVCHRCDNAKCVNPDHLWLGTYKDNSQDMVKKNRHRYAKKKRKGNTRNIK